MLAPDSVTAKRFPEVPADYVEVIDIKQQRLDLIRAKLFGKVPFASGLPAAFLERRQ
jgi:hypothetical protein